MRTPQAVIFDMDGTLLDSMGYWVQAPVDCLREVYGVEPPANVVDYMREVTLNQGGAVLQKKFNLPDTGDQVAANINSMVKRFYREKVSVRPGVMSWLHRLYTLGVPMVIATSTERSMVEAALERTGLTDYFDAIFTCGEVGVGKAHPDVYEAALAYLGTDKKETLVFEDSFFAMCTAKRAGFPVVGIYEESQDRFKDDARATVDLYLPAFDAVSVPF